MGRRKYGREEFEYWERSAGEMTKVKGGVWRVQAPLRGIRDIQACIV